MIQGGEPQGVQVVRQGEPTPYHCDFNSLYYIGFIVYLLYPFFQNMGQCKKQPAPAIAKVQAAFLPPHRPFPFQRRKQSPITTQTPKMQAALNLQSSLHPKLRQKYNSPDRTLPPAPAQPESAAQQQRNTAPNPKSQISFCYNMQLSNNL